MHCIVHESFYITRDVIKRYTRNRKCKTPCSRFQWKSLETFISMVKVYFTRPVFTEFLLYFYLINNRNFNFALVYFYFNLLWGIQLFRSLFKGCQQSTVYSFRCKVVIFRVIFRNSINIEGVLYIFYVNCTLFFMFT